MHSSEWKYLNSDSNFTDLCSLWSNWQYGSIGSDNGLAPTRRQAIMWTNDGQVWWRIYASLGPNELYVLCAQYPFCVHVFYSLIILLYFTIGPHVNQLIGDCMILYHYSDVIMSTKASQITGVSIVYATISSGADQRKHNESPASLVFVMGIHRWPVKSPHKGPCNAENVSIWWHHHNNHRFYWNKIKW